jgi:D-sedoheptulose 7-phosphate isomerase
MTARAERQPDFITSNRFASVVWNLLRIDKDALDRATEVSLNVKRAERNVFFIGNGASASIASHMAADWLKNAGIAAQCFNDGALTTCLANDLGYDQVFAKPLSLHGRCGDILFAISSSGQSPSILRGVEQAKARGVGVVTLSGFRPDNPLRAMGNVNFYVPSDNYGVVEVCHHAICHAILDAVIDASRD